MEHKHHHHNKHQNNHQHNHGDMIADFKKRFWICLILTIPVLILSPHIQKFLHLENNIRFTGDTYLLFILSSFIFFYGGYPFLKGLYQELSKGRPGMMTLIAVAISVAYFYSVLVVFGLPGEIFFWELVTLIDIMLLGHWIEMKSVLGASKALEQLAKLMPATAHKVESDGNIIDIPIDELKVDEKVLIKPGEKIPADGIVLSGESSVNESMLTGESKPIFKKYGSKVIGASINSEGSLIVKVLKTGKNSFLSQVIELVKEAEKTKSRTQDIANKAAFWLTIIALAGGAITLFAWLFFSNETFAFALERTVTVMVITCPHALGLAVPLVVVVSSAIAAQHGLLIRNRAAFEIARKTNAVVFDKTGTLTEGKFGITDIILLSEDHDKDKNQNINKDDEEKRIQDLIEYAAAVEVHSEHTIAKGIVSARQKNWGVENFKAIPGKGAEGLVEGKSVKVMSSGWFDETYFTSSNKVTDSIVANANSKEQSHSENKISKLLEQGKTVIYVVINDQLQGAIALADIIRPEAFETIKELKNMNIKTIMLSGDNKKVAQFVAEKLNIDEYFADVLPQDKVSKIKEVQNRGFIVAMTGDGINDAPAIVQADVGIAIGAGTNVAIESADIILVKSNPLDVVSTIKLAQSTTHKIIQNLLWATGYNAAAIPLAAGVLYNYGIMLSPAFGAVLMSLSTIIVAINAKLLRIKQ